MSTIFEDVESYVYMLKTEKTKKVFTKKQVSSQWEELKGFELAHMKMNLIKSIQSMQLINLLRKMVNGSEMSNCLSLM